MRETEETRGWAENKPIGRDELGKAHDEEGPRLGTDMGEALTTPDYVIRDAYLVCDIDLAIPGYVIWDFERNPGEAVERSKKPPLS